MFTFLNYNISISRSLNNILPISSSFYIGATGGGNARADFFWSTSYFCTKRYRLLISTTVAYVRIFINGIEKFFYTAIANQVQVMNPSPRLVLGDLIEIMVISDEIATNPAVIVTIEYRDISIESLSKHNSNDSTFLCNFSQMTFKVNGLNHPGGEIDLSAEWIWCSDASWTSIFFLEI